MSPRDYREYNMVNEGGAHETSRLNGNGFGAGNHLSFSEEETGHVDGKKKYVHWAVVAILLVLFGVFLHSQYDLHRQAPGTVYNISNPNADQHTEKDTGIVEQNETERSNIRAIGPYKLFQAQEGEKFFDFYNFFNGADSLGSAGYNRYVGSDRAFDLNIANVTEEITHGSNGREKTAFAYMSSSSTDEGPRESVRLEGKTAFNRGLFILDLRHMPAGCGIWPAFWLTNEENWPNFGEIDIVEGVNNQTKAKTAMHTSAMCSMYAHVADYNRTGVWERASKSNVPNGWHIFGT